MRFISFEGLDGAGKSSLIRWLEGELKKHGISYFVTREPGGTPLAESIRNLILKKDEDEPVGRTEILLYEASRSQHVERVIRPRILAGEWVLCDRFSESTVAFQCFGRGVDRSQVDWLNRFAEGGLRPELVIFLDLEVKESMHRLGQRLNRTQGEKDRIESESQSFHERVAQGYRDQAEKEPGRWLRLDAQLSTPQMGEIIIAEFKKRGWI